MKRQFAIVFLTALLAFVAGLFVREFSSAKLTASHDHSGEVSSEEKPEFYTCSMHPQIKQPSPGKCPLCGMDLIPVFNGQGGEDGPRELTMSPRAMKLAEVQSVPVERKFVTADVRMVGKVEYDETKMAYITSWVPGRLDRLFVDYTGVLVQQGDHLVELYSPELLQAQEELISAVSTASDLAKSQSEYLKGRGQTNVESSREKLRLWGLGEEQIQAIETRGEATDHITINSPISGVVVHKNAVEGMYVKTGSQIYTIADLSELWVKLDAYESDLVWLHYGQTVEFRTEAYPGEVFTGKIAFIDPILNAKTRTVKIRVNLPNPEGKLKPDMFVRAVVKSQVAAGGRVMDSGMAGKWVSPMHPEIIKDQPGECDICGMDLVSAESLGYVAAETDSAPLVIPSKAPLITGRRAVVYVDHGNGKYEGREISLGARAGDYYLVESGLEEGEKVVTNGNFKIDSAVQILAKPSMMNPGGGGNAPGHNHGESSPSTAAVEADLQSFVVPEEFKQQLGGLVRAYVDVKDELSHDNYDEGQSRISALQDALEAVDMSLTTGDSHMAWMNRLNDLKSGIGQFDESADLASSRAAFEVVSNSLSSSVREFGASGDHPVLLYHCPMAFGGRGADWLQVTEGTENPYYGSKMFKCGSLKETLAPLGEVDGEMGHEGHQHDE